MKRLIYILLLCCLCVAVHAQFHEEEHRVYTVDVRQYGNAVRDIVRNGNYVQGVASLTELIDKCELMPDYSLTYLATYYSARAQGRLRLKQYDTSVEDCRKAIDCLQKAGQAGKPDLSDVWYKLTIVYYNWGKLSEAMAAADSCVKTAADYYGPLHSTTKDAYSLRSNMAGYSNLKNVALADRHEIFKIIQTNVERNFVYLTTAERTAYWSKQLPETTIMFAFAHKMGEQESSFTDDLYDQQLLAKGLLLTAESSLQRAIDNDASLRAAYQKIRQLRMQAANSKTSPEKADEVTMQADRLERDLGTSAYSVHQFMDFLKIHVDDVRKQLTENDVAVEFVDYRVGKDSTMYAALVLSPRWQHVRFIPLIEAKEVSKYADNLAPYIWQPVIDALGYSPCNIYFAPTGLLYQMPIESQPLASGALMSEAFRMYRVSSTRWLVNDEATVEGHDAVVYGGLVYNADDLQEDDSPTTRGAIDDVPYLAGTKTEAETIVEIINAGHRQHAEAFIGSLGTAATFKALSGQRKAIVHVATHGFYEPPQQTSDAQDDPLTRSGLYFAGSEVLTAKEIAALDLQGQTLTVLSACQTGQGDVTSDGVFGLQRGFKKAGANSILMSLWKVDDDATSLLMKEFYRNWIADGQTKYEALENAKRTIRSNKEKGWDNPKYWAAFILLDGLN